MSYKVWGLLNERQQFIQELRPTNNHILMVELRPTGNSIAQVDGTWIEAEPTPDELKLIGVEFEGVMCSATSDDQAGLAWVIPLIKSGTDINPFKFQNGTTLKLTSSNIEAFEAVWIPFREGFFAPPPPNVKADIVTGDLSSIKGFEAVGYNAANGIGSATPYCIFDGNYITEIAAIKETPDNYYLTVNIENLTGGVLRPNFADGFAFDFTWDAESNCFKNTQPLAYNAVTNNSEYTFEIESYTP